MKDCIASSLPAAMWNSKRRSRTRTNTSCSSLRAGSEKVRRLRTGLPVSCSVSSRRPVSLGEKAGRRASLSVMNMVFTLGDSTHVTEPMRSPFCTREYDWTPGASPATCASMVSSAFSLTDIPSCVAIVSTAGPWFFFTPWPGGRGTVAPVVVSRKMVFPDSVSWLNCAR